MDYILSDTELDKLVPKSEVERLEAALDWLRKQCVPKCIHFRHPSAYAHCSECPLGRLGDDGPPRNLRPICTQDKSYPK